MERDPLLENALENLGMAVFGRSRELARAGNQCIKCGGLATDFRDEVSRREYNITHFCQKCQDEIFQE